MTSSLQRDGSCPGSFPLPCSNLRKLLYLSAEPRISLYHLYMRLAAPLLLSPSITHSGVRIQPGLDLFAERRPSPRVEPLSVSGAPPSPTETLAHDSLNHHRAPTGTRTTRPPPNRAPENITRPTPGLVAPRRPRRTDFFHVCSLLSSLSYKR